MLLAFKDMLDELGDKDNNFSDVWNVRPYHLNNKRTRRLNRELNLHSINK